mgnify:FL=1
MRYLVVGLGNIGAKRKAVLGDRCVATVDPVTLMADYKDVRDVQEVYDAAILAVPNADKVPLLEFFLQRSTPVLVEKPLILDPVTGERLRQMAERSSTIWYTAYNFRFEPYVLALRRDIEAGVIGRLYRARLFYGNGTAARIKGTWRDDEYGVLADMASHLIDLTGFLFGLRDVRFHVCERQRYELLRGPDHCLLTVEPATLRPHVVIECSFLWWENRWSIEVTGELGMLMMTGLTKWGQTQLHLKRRKFPSGVPDSVCYSGVGGGDDQMIWAADLQHFEERVARGESSYDNDLWISRTVIAAARAVVD